MCDVYRGVSTSRDDSARKKTKPLTRRVAWVLVLFSIAGCGEATSIPTAHSNSPARLCLTVLLDRSGSYQDFATAKRVAIGSASQLEPGDEIAVRWISDESYRPRELVLDRIIPVVRRVENAFDRAQKRQAQMDVLRAKASVHEVMKELSELDPPRASYTDVWGSVLAAQEWFESIPCNREVIVAVSDLRHNRGALPELSLRGVEFIVAAFEHDGDVYDTQRVRAAAQALLERAGAKVTFLPPGRIPRLRPAQRESEAR